MDSPNKPTLSGYLELLWRALVATIVLIFMGVLCAIAVIIIPFALSLVLTLALVGAGVIIFDWLYVFAGTAILLILIGMTLK